jgi:hypothetical protein
MADPRRLLDAGASPIERALLRSADADAPDPQAVGKVLAALGVGGAVVVAGSASTAAAATATATTAGTAATATAGTAATAGLAAAATAGAGKAAALGGSLVATWIGAVVVGGALVATTVGELRDAGDGPALLARDVPAKVERGPTRADRVPPPPPPPAPIADPALAPIADPPVDATTAALAAAAQDTVAAPAPAPPVVAAPDLAPAPVDAPASPAAADAPTDRARSARTRPAGSLERELALLDRARRELAAGHPRAALAAVRDFTRAFPRATLAPEAELLRLECYAALGDHRRVRSLGERFLSRHPKSPLAPRVLTLLEREDSP